MLALLVMQASCYSEAHLLTRYHAAATPRHASTAHHQPYRVNNLQMRLAEEVEAAAAEVKAAQALEEAAK